jgi:ABC-type phosphate transport system substrate-binding protein
MSHKPSRARLLGLTLIFVSLSGSAYAQNTVGNCLYHEKGNGGKNVIFMPGSTSLIPVVQFLGSKLIKMKTPYVLVYLPKASCEALRMVNRAEFVSGAGEFYEEDPKNPAKVITNSCTIDGKVALDMAIGDTFYETCSQNEARIEGLGDFQGAQQAFVFITPRSNYYANNITAEQARVIFGCGPNGKVAPYLDDNFIFKYKDVGVGGGEYGAQLIVGKSINLSNFRNPTSGQTGDPSEADAVAASISSEKTIGFVSAEIYDQRRDLLKSLAFRGYKQQLAYYPDSDANSRDKRNVRDGHYMIQAPMHLWAAVNKDGSVVRPLARKLIDWMQGNPVADEDALPFDINEVYAQAGVVPKCAMKVMRQVDGGPLRPFVSDKPPCGCFYESKATGVAVPNGCVTCKDATACGKIQVCSLGFCEGP